VTITDNYVIAEAWLSKITEGRMLSPHDKEELQEYADDLRSCEQTLQAMNYLSEVNTQRVLVKIVARLPMYLQNRWVRHASDIRLSEGRSADIHNLVSFVTKAVQRLMTQYMALLWQVSHRNLEVGRITLLEQISTWQPNQWPVIEAVVKNVDFVEAAIQYFSVRRIQKIHT